MVSDAGTPAIESDPCVGASKPAIRRKSVDFPQPDGPTSATNSPLPSENDTSCSAAYPPGKVMPRPAARRNGSSGTEGLNTDTNDPVVAVGRSEERGIHFGRWSKYSQLGRWIRRNIVAM